MEYPKITDNSIYKNITVEENNNDIRFLGYEMGKLTKILHENNVVIFKENGHNYWSGIGQTSYSSPRYFIGYYKNGTFNCYKEIEYDRKTVKKAKELAIEIFKEIE
jgi:hypothetical protein